MINTLQENNKNILAITSDLRTISEKMAAGDGTLVNLWMIILFMTDIDTKHYRCKSPQKSKTIGKLAWYLFSEGFNKKGTLANQLVTDTTIFNSVKTTVLQLQNIADTATLFIADLLKKQVAILIRLLVFCCTMKNAEHS